MLILFNLYSRYTESQKEIEFLKLICTISLQNSYLFQTVKRPNCKGLCAHVKRELWSWVLQKNQRQARKYFTSPFEIEIWNRTTLKKYFIFTTFSIYVIMMFYRLRKSLSSVSRVYKTWSKITWHITWNALLNVIKDIRGVPKFYIIFLNI